jgi:hypothetical protein
MSELEYDHNWATELTSAGITPASNPINLRGVIKAILSGMLTATLPAVLNAANLPTTDPHVAGQLWVNSGVVTRSAG